MPINHENESGQKVTDRITLLILVTISETFTWLASEIIVKASKLRNLILKRFPDWLALISSVGSIFDDETFWRSEMKLQKYRLLEQVKKKLFSLFQ